MNGDAVDSNAITSIYAKGGGAETLLFKAIIGELNGNNTIFYINRNKAEASLSHPRVQFPGPTQLANGLIHSISDNPDFVNLKIKNQTETRQFKRWFGKSKVVDEDGAPLVVYH